MPLDFMTRRRRAQLNDLGLQDPSSSLASRVNEKHPRCDKRQRLQYLGLSEPFFVPGFSMSSSLSFLSFVRPFSAALLFIEKHLGFVSALVACPSISSLLWYPQVTHRKVAASFLRGLELCRYLFIGDFPEGAPVEYH